MDKGAFNLDETFVYQTKSKIFGQMQNDSCVAAACRMVLPNGDDIPEAFLRIITNVITGEGTYLRNAVVTLQKFGIVATYQSNLSIPDLSKFTEDKPAIVSVKTSLTIDAHALVVDKIENSLVFIRDPLPEGTGSAYQVKIETFTKVWTGNAIIIVS